MTEVIPVSSSYIPAIPLGADPLNSKIIIWETEVRRAALSAAGVHGPDVVEACVQAGRKAVWRAHLTFNEARGVPLEHFVRRSIVNRILTELALLDDPRTATGAAENINDLTLEIGGIGVRTPEEDFAAAERSRIVRTWLRGESASLQMVFELVYVRGLTQAEAAEAMGVTQPRINQLKKQLLERGRSALVALAA